MHKLCQVFLYLHALYSSIQKLLLLSFWGFNLLLHYDGDATFSVNYYHATLLTPWNNVTIIILSFWLLLTLSNHDFGRMNQKRSRIHNMTSLKTNLPPKLALWWEAWKSCANSSRTLALQRETRRVIRMRNKTNSKTIYPDVDQNRRKWTALNLNPRTPPRTLPIQ